MHETRQKVLTLLRQDFTVREVAALCGVSTQRVYQLREEFIKAGDYEGGRNGDHE